MKSFNQITVEYSGRKSEIFAGDMVIFVSIIKTIIKDKPIVCFDSNNLVITRLKSGKTLLKYF